MSKVLKNLSLAYISTEKTWYTNIVVKMAQNSQVRVEEGVDLPIRGDHWKHIFDKYDANRDGKIDIHELKEIINSREYEHDIPDSVMQRILTMSDTDRNGYLDYQEFVRMIHNPYLESLFGHFVQSYIHAVIPRRRGPGSRTDVTDGLYEDEYSWCPPPVWMLLISLIEIVLFCIDAAHGSAYDANGPVAESMIYDPQRRNEVWRFFSYMFVHVGPLHLIVNLAVQILLGIPLEMVHRGWRVMIIYCAGVVAGSLGTSITDPTVKLAGASGGVYALITAHIASVIINWREMQFALLQLIVFLIITAIDFGTAIYNRYYLDLDEHIGYAAHLAGAIAGLLVGIFALRNLEVNSCEKKLWWVSLVTFLALLATAIIWNIAYPAYFVKQY
ncbi:rhomboid-4 [Carabus blaptoides fortunei]